jgi:hypothetical protein
MSKDARLENYLSWLADRVSPYNRHLHAARQAYARFQETAHTAPAEGGRRRRALGEEMAS